MVDLDAARTGESVNEGVIAEVVRETGLNVQTGGGVRTMGDIERKLKLGVKRAIIGTAAVKRPEFAAEAVREFGNAVAVGIDARDGMVAAHGWVDVGTVSAVEMAARMAGYGVRTIIYTDIAKDGMMGGPNVGMTGEIVRAVGNGCGVIASGGVSCMEDIYALKEAGIPAVITGKAIYEGKIKIEDLEKSFV